MRPLEDRRWFILLTIATSAFIMIGYFKVAGIELGLRTGFVFLMATMGQAMGVNKILALVMIRMNPALGNL